MKKKILVIALTILLVALMIVGLHMAKKVTIIHEFSRKVEEYQKLTNYYVKENYTLNNSEVRTNEKWCKGDIRIQKNTSEDGTMVTYFNKEEILVLLDNADSPKKGARFKRDKNNSFTGVVIEDASYYIEDNLWEEIKAAFTTKITSEKVNGKECYQFYIDDDFQFFVDKENMLKIKEINGSTNRIVVDYRIGNVTDEEVQMPSTEGYTIQEDN